MTVDELEKLVYNISIRQLIELQQKKPEAFNHLNSSLKIALEAQELKKSKGVLLTMKE